MADLIQEVFDYGLALGGMHYLGVKLQAVPVTVVPHDGYGGVVGVCQGGESGRWLGDVIAVAHPDLHRFGQRVEQGVARRALVHHRVAVFALGRRRYAAA